MDYLIFLSWTTGPTLSIFECYLLSLGIHHALMAPFHPASNGQAEQMVNSAKEALSRMGQGDWHEQVSKYLLMQHIILHRVTGRSPSELFMGHCLRSPSDSVTPKPSGSSNLPRTFLLGDQIYVRHYAREVAWVPSSGCGCLWPSVILDGSGGW